jgi:hypothetical protein
MLEPMRLSAASRPALPACTLTSAHWGGEAARGESPPFGSGRNKKGKQGT